MGLDILVLVANPAEGEKIEAVLAPIVSVRRASVEQLDALTAAETKAVVVGCSVKASALEGIFKRLQALQMGDVPLLRCVWGDTAMLADEAALANQGQPVRVLEISESSYSDLQIALAQVIEGDSAEVVALREHISSLPWILENVATRLEHLAGRLRDEQKRGTPVFASSKMVKEALLCAFAADTGPEADFADRLIRLLRSQGRAEAAGLDTPSRETKK